MRLYTISSFLSKAINLLASVILAFYLPSQIFGIFALISLYLAIGVYLTFGIQYFIMNRLIEDRSALIMLGTVLAILCSPLILVLFSKIFSGLEVIDPILTEFKSEIILLVVVNNIAITLNRISRVFKTWNYLIFDVITLALIPFILLINNEIGNYIGLFILVRLLSIFTMTYGIYIKTHLDRVVIRLEYMKEIITGGLKLLAYNFSIGMPILFLFLIISWMTTPEEFGIIKFSWTIGTIPLLLIGVLEGVVYPDVFKNVSENITAGPNTTLLSINLGITSILSLLILLFFKTPISSFVLINENIFFDAIYFCLINSLLYTYKIFHLVKRTEYVLTLLFLPILAVTYLIYSLGYSEWLMSCFLILYTLIFAFLSLSDYRRIKESVTLLLLMALLILRFFEGVYFEIGLYVFLLVVVGEVISGLNKVLSYLKNVILD